MSVYALHCNNKQKAFSTLNDLTLSLDSLSFFTYIWSLFSVPVLCACCLNRTLLTFLWLAVKVMCIDYVLDPQVDQWACVSVVTIDCDKAMINLNFFKH